MNWFEIQWSIDFGDSCIVCICVFAFNNLIQSINKLEDSRLHI